MDILLDEETHDCVFINGQTPVTQGVRDSLKQRLKIKLMTFLGEWFLDTTYGIPYFQQLMGKNRRLSTVDAAFRKAILEDPDVREITDFNSSLVDRRYSLIFSVRANNGEEVQDLTLEANL